MTLPDESTGCNWEKSRNLKLVGASTTKWQLINHRVKYELLKPNIYWFISTEIVFMLFSIDHYCQSKEHEVDSSLNEEKYCPY